jgi:hypothetical protein
VQSEIGQPWSRVEKGQPFARIADVSTNTLRLNRDLRVSLFGNERIVTEAPFDNLTQIESLQVWIHNQPKLCLSSTSLQHLMVIGSRDNNSCPNLLLMGNLESLELREIKLDSKLLSVVLPKRFVATSDLLPLKCSVKNHFLKMELLDEEHIQLSRVPYSQL